MNKTYIEAAVIIGTLTSSHCAAAKTVGSEAIWFAFHLHGQDIVHDKGITAGMTIGQQNWQAGSDAV